MPSLNRAFEVQGGLLVLDGESGGPFYTGGAGSPLGLDLPVDTFYVQNAGLGGAVVWRKYGAATSEWVKASPMDFFQTQESVAETSTTSTTVWSSKLTLVTPSLPSGDYTIEFMYKWRNAAANRRQDTRIQRNAANVLVWESFNPNTSEASLQSGLIKFSAISGVQTFTLDFKVVGSGTTTYMSEARFFFRRVA